jgi:hypothetical protein
LTEQKATQEARVTPRFLPFSVGVLAPGGAGIPLFCAWRKGEAMSWSWLYDRREQLDGYKPFAHIAYTLRRHILPEDRDDMEMDIILKLKDVSDKRNGRGEGMPVSFPVTKGRWCPIAGSISPMMPM